MGVTRPASGGSHHHGVALVDSAGGEHAGIPPGAPRADVVAQASMVTIGEPPTVLGAGHRRSGHEGRHVANLHDESGPNL